MVSEEFHHDIHVYVYIYIHRAAHFYHRPADYLPLHFGLNFRNLCYNHIKACYVIYMCSLYHSVHKSTINNPNLCNIGVEIFN